MNFLIPSNTTSKISVFIIWLFHLCGMVGISYGNKDFFLAFTPINLFISFVLLFVNQKQLESKELKSAFLIFFIGMVSEILGVNYGLIFGDYVYLDNLGVKILGVPVLIGVNWIILTFITGSLSSFIFKNKYVSILMGAILMIGLDLLIEPVAPLLGFWIFDLQKVPLQNYLGWFVIGMITQALFQFKIAEKELTFSTHLLIINAIFFAFLNYQIV
ncbi:MAG: carotenoid biosynthesis protein [Flavobacteriaceae bacterium]|jgi:putative membrane protein|nr:carotenoid biosynthesis protein [Flavobacteriaceae bacterium]MDA7566343.1 carotenoid biosynthesis protein [Flavobacteriaceae bacterium]MDB4601345.1 carotenoid biosynthesis protein [Flavobacteriaceae bacterium]MDB9846731.1 carotenoid biosynthesis protein [Flavobacteriaceae bacterium]MDC0506953.1 carotenoid biosynthesis protein [Flavobacteriaceae bacterium]